jgi:hypothetical protein
VRRALPAVLCAALLVPASADAAAKRVVAIEWDTVENLHMLGLAPVGAADMTGYDTWVAAPRPRGMKDIGSRQSPSIERIAALKPDLIVVPDYRSTKSLSQLKKIAPVLVTHPYPASGTQFNAMVTDFRRLADAVGRRSRGETVLQDLSNNLARNKTALKRGGRAGAAVAISTPWRHLERTRDPHVHAEFAERGRGAAVGVAGRLGRHRSLRLHDDRARGPVAGERVARVRLPAAVRQAGVGDHQAGGVQTPPGREGEPRPHAERHHMAVRRPALDDALRRPPHGSTDVIAAR